MAKKIENKEVKFASTPTSIKTYKDLVTACINYVTERGVTQEDQKKRFRILDAIEKEGDIILEDADYELLKSLVNVMPWALVSKEIVEFSDAVVNAETVTL